MGTCMGKKRAKSRASTRKDGAYCNRAADASPENASPHIELTSSSEPVECAESQILLSADVVLSCTTDAGGLYIATPVIDT
jgi:hypothetical protein